MCRPAPIKPRRHFLPAISSRWARARTTSSTSFPTRSGPIAQVTRARSISAKAAIVIGGLLLLPKSVNRSLNDDPYVQKRGKYGTQNTLAKTLDPTAYQNDPQFNRVVSEFGFRHLDAFTRSEAEERQAVYARLAERIWSPERLWREAGVATPVPAATAEAAE